MRCVCGATRLWCERGGAGKRGGHAVAERRGRRGGRRRVCRGRGRRGRRRGGAVTAAAIFLSCKPAAAVICVHLHLNQASTPFWHRGFERARSRVVSLRAARVEVAIEFAVPRDRAIGTLGGDDGLRQTWFVPTRTRTIRYSVGSLKTSLVCGISRKFIWGVAS